MRKINNFDILRLGAAVTVFLFHLSTTGFLKGHAYASFAHNLYRVFPGVPVFFVISGFLLTNSWMLRPEPARFFKARFLRIYPALVLSTAFTCLWLFLSGYSPPWSWVLTQLSLFNTIATPPQLLGFSGEMPNAPLWTIMVESQFYLMLPLLLMLRTSAAIYILMAVSAFIQVFQLNAPPSVTAFFWWFGMGVILRRQWHGLRRFLEGRVLHWLLAHGVLVACLVLGNLLPVTCVRLLLSLTLAPLVVAAAFTVPHLSRRLLRHDLSYGIYLYHFPLLYLAMHFGFSNGVAAAACVAAATGIFAALSWFLIEKPALSLRR